MPFQFSSASLANLIQVKPELVQLAQIAITSSSQDFAVTCGVRSVEAEREAVACGHSKTMNSKHIIQPDGFSHAIDCVPYQGTLTWDWNLIYPIVRAFHTTSLMLGIAPHIRWGGAWDRTMDDFTPGTDWAKVTESYKERYLAADPGHHTAFVDGPHFEWVP